MKKLKINRHFVFIEAPLSLVWPEVLAWGEASWWPKGCRMRFIRQTEGEVAVGTRFEQRVLLPLGPRWHAQVTRCVHFSTIERTFVDGLFRGLERVTVEERANGTRVDYTMEYRIRGAVNALLWDLVFERLHDQNLEMILAALKRYMTEKMKEAS